MNRGMMIFVGCVLTFSSSWLGLVTLPYWQLNAEPAYETPAGAYPLPPTAAEQAGRTQYQALGCLYCHSQQVRSQHFGNGADIARGWGQRRTVSRDYLYDRPILLGTMRTGPDLAAIGERNSSPSWHHEHLLNPRSKAEWSIMPAFAFLYERKPVENGTRDPRALDLGREWTVRPGHRWTPGDAEWAAALEKSGPELKKRYEAAHPGQPLTLDGADLLAFWLGTPEENFQVVPKPEADALVTYLLSLKKTATPLPEANEP